MRILKKNTNLGNLRFDCTNCGTLFVAKRGEYSQSLGNKYTQKYNNFFTYLGIGNTHIAIPSWHILVDCPSCGATQFKYLPTGEPEYETPNPYDWP